MFSFESRIRYSEVGTDGRLKVGTLVDYFQDCSMFHSEDAGIGIEILKKRKQGWFLVSWQIVIESLPKLGDGVRVSTWPYEFKGFWGKRNFMMEDQQGKRLAYANSLWTFMSMETQRPMRMTQEQIDGYPVEKKLDMNYASRKIKVTQEGVRQKPILALESQMDTNFHMNNSQYVKVAQEYLPNGTCLSQIRVDYRKPVAAGVSMTPVIYALEDTYTVMLEDEKEEAYALIEFQINKERI